MNKLASYAKSALQGKLLLRLGVDKYLDRIIYFFIVVIGIIYVNIRIEKTISIKENNKEKLENLRSVHTDMTCRLTSLNCACKIEKMLEEKGSQVRIPVKRAQVAEKVSK